ncbi:MAG: hypothetical protein KAU20_00645, partial [Nanoarchaeota archaeon]|nr:hypothetical protein [Nanoarchaeota archaeon]
SLFFREDVHGNNRLISKHSLNWNKLTEGFNASLYNIDNEQDFSKKDQARRHVFNALKEAEVNFIDVRKIPEFISNPDLSEISGGFQDQATAENYKEELIQQLMRGGTNRSSAEREYKEIVAEQLNKLHEFQSEVESRLEKLLKKEEVGHISELSDKSKMLYEQFIKTNSPFSFNESYENNKDSEIEVRYENKSGVIVTGKSPSTMNYTSFLPTTENFYSDTYKNKIENNDILYKYWETSSDAISYINRNRKYQKETEELERDEDGKIIRKYNPQQDYDDSLSYEYEISKEHSTFILNMGKYAPRAVWDRLKTTLSTARYRDTSGNMKIKGEIKSIDDVVKSGMKDMSRVLKAHNISLTKELDIKKVPAEVLAYLEKRYGGEIPTDGTVNSIVKRISEREVLKSQKVNLTDSLISQLGAVETFKNKKEAEMQLLFAKNMFTKLNKSKSVDETSNGAKQISNFINYHLYGVNNRANWNTGKQGDVGASITSLQRKNLVDYTNSSIPLIQKAIEEINNNPLLNDSEKLNEAVRLDKLLEDAKSFTETGGRVITTGSVFEAVFLKLGILAGLGLNLKSQVHNILIGDLAGRQNDGEQWKEGNYADAVSYTRRWKRAGMGVMKNFGAETKMMKNQRLTKTLLNDIGIFQNSA